MGGQTSRRQQPTICSTRPQCYGAAPATLAAARMIARPTLPLNCLHFHHSVPRQRRHQHRRHKTAAKGGRTMMRPIAPTLR